MVRVLGQFWRLLGLSIGGTGGKLGIVLYAVVLALELSQILVSLRMIEWSKAFYDALQQIDAAEALTQLGIFAVIMVIAVTLTVGSNYVRRHLELRWRTTLTTAFMSRWLNSKAFLRLERERGKGSNTPLDNPDQRIAEDCRFFLAGPQGEHGGGSGIIPLSLDLITNVVAIFSYVAVLWGLSTFSLPLGFIGIDAEIPHYMVWAAFLYVALSTSLTHLLGRPLRRLYGEQQRREADFRFGLVRVRENAEPIALTGGEAAETRDLNGRFARLLDNGRRLIGRETRLMSFTYPYRYTVLRIPTFLALPAFFAGSVTFGGLMQLASAFSQVVTTLSWFIFSYRPLADLVAASSRLDAFLDATGEAPIFAGGPERTPSNDGALALSKIEVFTPDGAALLGIDALKLKTGEAIWLSGASGLGKTTLIKTIAGVWPHAKGLIGQPSGNALFLPQQAYFPPGMLTEIVAYPHAPETFPLAGRIAALQAVGLGDRLESDGNAEGRGLGLSGGEQQRLALARLLLLRPDWAFLDEATSALDAAAEASLLALLRRELPNTGFVIVAHRKPQGIGALTIVELSVASPAPSPSLEPALA
ncbi:ABC transporter ATP-binding protein/permease [Devosia sp. A16]|uniref:ABC transporter ATP-binding protein/permease n=1 Tax=Devosia sp. A16 TaxID=1736675 RepID=UPI0009EACF21|nr:SbmA/BacA-like family transporter [Devosia sp. A16]